MRGGGGHEKEARDNGQRPSSPDRPLLNSTRASRRSGSASRVSSINTTAPPVQPRDRSPGPGHRRASCAARTSSGARAGSASSPPRPRPASPARPTTCGPPRCRSRRRPAARPGRPRRGRAGSSGAPPRTPQGVERVLDLRGVEGGEAPPAPHRLRARDPVAGRPLQIEAQRLLPVRSRAPSGRTSVTSRERSSPEAPRRRPRGTGTASRRGEPRPACRRSHREPPDGIAYPA